MRNIADKNVEKIKTHFMRKNVSPKTCRLGDNLEKCTGGQATDDNVILRIGFACFVSKATNTHPEFVTLIVFPRQQWFRERSSVLRYAYIACLVIYLFFYSNFIIVLHSKGRRRVLPC
jgi:hypothetical protein